MKILSLKVRGTSEQLANVVTLVMKNPCLELIALSKENDTQHTEGPAPQASPVADNGSHSVSATYRKYGRDPRAVWDKRGYLDPEATAHKMGVTIDQLRSQSWRRGTLQAACVSSYGQRMASKRRKSQQPKS